MVKIKGDRSMFIYLAMIDSPEEKLKFEIIYERYKNDAQCAISVQNGTASASANVSGKRGAEKCKIVLKIQEEKGNHWVTLDSWTVEEDSLRRLSGCTKPC